MLQVLADEGHDVLRVVRDAGAVEVSLDRGLPAVQDDGVHFLARAQPDSLKAVFCRQMVGAPPDVRTRGARPAVPSSPCDPRASWSSRRSSPAAPTPGAHRPSRRRRRASVHPRRCASSASRPGSRRCCSRSGSPHPALALGDETARRRGGRRRADAARERLRLPGLRDRRRQVTRFDAVHQFHSGTARGDAITNQMLDVQAHLRRHGLADRRSSPSTWPPNWSARSLPIGAYAGSDAELLIVHHSFGSDCFDDVMDLPNPVGDHVPQRHPGALLRGPGGQALLPTRPRPARVPGPAVAVRHGRLQLQPHRDAGRGIPSGRRAPGAGRLLRVRTGRPGTRAAVGRLAVRGPGHPQQAPAPRSSRPLPPTPGPSTPGPASTWWGARPTSGTAANWRSPPSACGSRTGSSSTGRCPTATCGPCSPGPASTCR